MARFMPQYQMPDASLMLVDYSPLARMGEALGQGIREIGNNMRQSRREEREDERWQQEFQAQQEHRQWQRSEATAEREATEEYREAMIENAKLRTWIQGWTAVQDNRRAIKAEAGRQKLLDMEVDKAEIQTGMLQETWEQSKASTQAKALLAKVPSLVNEARKGNPTAITQLNSYIASAPALVQRFPETAKRFGITEKNLPLVQQALLSNPWREEAYANLNGGMFQDRVTGEVFDGAGMAEFLEQNPDHADDMKSIPAAEINRLKDVYHSRISGTDRDIYGNETEYIKQVKFGAMFDRNDPDLNLSPEALDEQIALANKAYHNPPEQEFDTGKIISNIDYTKNVLQQRVDDLKNQIASADPETRGDILEEMREPFSRLWGMTHADEYRTIQHKRRDIDAKLEDPATSPVERFWLQVRPRFELNPEQGDNIFLASIGSLFAGAKDSISNLFQGEDMIDQQEAQWGSRLMQLYNQYDEAVGDPQAQARLMDQIQKHYRSGGMNSTEIVKETDEAEKRKIDQRRRKLLRIKQKRERVASRGSSDGWLDLQRQYLQERIREREAKEKETSRSAVSAEQAFSLWLEQYKDKPELKGKNKAQKYKLFLENNPQYDTTGE